MKGLTKRQREIIDYIKQFIDTKQYSPSYREIMAHFNFSCVGSVSKHIQALKRKGALINEKNCSRSLAVEEALSQPIRSQEVELPLIGTISAGNPIELFPRSQSITVPEALIHDHNSTYVLKAKGNSLEEEMIIDGDLLIIEARQNAETGETVVALINNHDTIIKQYYPEGTYVRLVGYNPHHHPIIVRDEDLAIQAVVIGLIRPFRGDLAAAKG
jgi:repressor LexA